MENEKAVIQILKKSSRALSAYEILDKFSVFKKVKPMTIYRCLDNLLKSGFVHKSYHNRKFFICNQEKKGSHNFSVLLCKKCGKNEELKPQVAKTIKSKIKSNSFDLSKLEIQIFGLCNQCLK